MMDARALRIGGWAGIVFTVFSLGGLPCYMPPPPILGSSGAAFAAWLHAHGLEYRVGNYLAIVGALPALVQLVVLAGRVRRLEGGAGLLSLSSLVLAAGIVYYSFSASTIAVFQVLPFLAVPGLDGVLQGMGSLASVWLALTGILAVPFLVSVGWATVSTKALPRWFAKLSWVVAIVAFVESLGTWTTAPAWFTAGGPIGGVALLLQFAWTVTLSVLLLRLARAAPHA